MFKIDSNQNIRISRGDDSGIFSLFVNAGSDYEPARYRFHPVYQISTNGDLVVTVDKTTFSQKVQEDGSYKFDYNYDYDEQGQRTGELCWRLNLVPVELSDYGISYVGEPQVLDHILINYHGNIIPEVHFIVMNVNDNVEHFIFKKIFRTDDMVITQYDNCRYTQTKEVNNIVNERYDMNLFIDGCDTQEMPGGEYTYLVKIKFWDEESSRYVLNTITHRNSFFVID